MSRGAHRPLFLLFERVLSLGAPGDRISLRRCYPILHAESKTVESKSLDAIKEQLHQERRQIETQADKLRAELAGLDEDLARISSAIAALEGTEPATAISKAGKPKERKKMSTPSAGKADVIKCMQDILAKQGVVEAEALKGLVEQQITEAGFTRMGFSLRYKEALADARFVDTPAGVRLKNEKPSPVKA